MTTTTDVADTATAIAAGTPQQIEPLPAGVAEQLALLRDVHLPDTINWWPLAPGWWAVGAAVLVAVLAAVILQYRNKRSMQRHALRELSSLTIEFNSQAQLPELATEVGKLLRRVALKQFGREGVAELNGEPWAAYLVAGKYGMSDSSAQFCSLAPYLPTDGSAAKLLPADINTDAIVDAAKRWIRGNAK